MADADPFPARGDTVAVAHDAPARRAWRRPVAMLGVPLVIIAATIWWWFGSPGRVETDNAYVKQDIIGVTGEVPGLVTAVKVRENQVVRAGDVLFTIDPAPYQVAIAQADAQIAQAQATVISLRAEVGASAAEIAGARNDLRLAEANYSRESALMERGFNTRASMDAATHAVAAARDRLASVQAEVAKQEAKLATGSAVPGVNPAIAAAQATRAKADYDLKRTVVRAPADGIVTQAGRLQVGQSVFPGVPLLSLVRTGSARVDANFKETDLAHMAVGQPARIWLDAYPGLELAGRVKTIGAGTGSEFAILPAQNATGNWVKIIQRVPVRIEILGHTSRPLIAGLSATVEVDTRKR